MTSVANLRDKIKQSATSNWEFIDTPETWILQGEDLVIEEVGTNGFGETRSISQPSFASLPDPDHDEETQIRVKHKGTPFDQLPVLSLDGHKITMIQPKTDHNQGVKYLSDYEAQLSQIMSQDDFLARQGNTINVQIR